MSLPSTSDTTATKTEAASLVRELGTIDAAMIVVGSMIGSGIFITSAESRGSWVPPAGCSWRGAWRG